MSKENILIHNSISSPLLIKVYFSAVKGFNEQIISSLNVDMVKIGYLEKDRGLNILS